jgi:hypothetical protein
MSQPLRFPALSAPQVWVPRKTFLPALFSAGIVKDHFKRGSVASSHCPAGMTFPYDFGFVPSTEADDGDPVDVLVLMSASRSAFFFFFF